jgi:hypothetical protein
VRDFAFAIEVRECVVDVLHFILQQVNRDCAFKRLCMREQRACLLHVAVGQPGQPPFDVLG